MVRRPQMRYIRFHYDGHLINLVHPVSYIARGSVIVRSDADGLVRIPGRVHFRRPLPLSTPPSLFIDHVYGTASTQRVRTDREADDAAPRCVQHQRTT